MENENLIRKIAWSFNRSTGIEFDDLFQEAYIAYVKAMESYNPKKGKISTHVWFCISSHLKNYIKEEKKQTDFCVSMEGTDVKHEPDIQPKPFWEKLNKEAIVITNIIISAPKLFMDIPTKTIESKITGILLSKGWGMKKIKQGLQNLSSIYR